jgi:hypothetical protein
VLPLRISGIRELTPRVRAYELSAADGSRLPSVQAGAHLDVPVQLLSGAASTHRYSIAAYSEQRQTYEIAVLREDAGRGGSAAVHSRLRIGQTLHCGLPGNDFALHADTRPALLIAGGIGITPIQTSGAPVARHWSSLRAALCGALGPGGRLPAPIAGDVGPTFALSW